MDPAHIHLLTNHIPVIGTLFGLVVLLYGMLGKKHDVTRASLGLFVLAGSGAGIAYLSGERSEDTVEGLPGVTEAFVEAHEEAALIALIAAIVLGVVALLVLLFRRQQIPRWATVTTLVLALGTMGVMGWTANLGGQIRHTEIRDATLTVTVPNGGEVPAAHDDYDDDGDD